MRRSHYQHNLYEAALDAGVQVRLGARVETMDVGVPSVTLAGGETLSVNLVVMADGRCKQRPISSLSTDVKQESSQSSAT